MASKNSKPIKSIRRKSEEKVLVVGRGDLFVDGVWNGIKKDKINKLIKIVSIKHKFIARGICEEDPNYKQIIPYLIFENKGKIFVMKRKSDHTDKRLANKYSIGVGGHINKEDVKSPNILKWAQREFEEEIDYRGKYKMEILGFLNDDSNEVGMVHTGLIVKVVGTSAEIKIRDEHKSGELMDLAEAGKHYRQMETWSQITYDLLMGKGSNNTSVKFLGGVMPDWIIEEYIDKGLIKIDPLIANWRQAIDQVSIDFHLGVKLKLFRSGAYRFVDTKRGLPADAMEEVVLQDGDPFILEPGAFAIASTSEVLKLPKDVLGRLEGKSSLARLGILVHSTAARFDPGWNGAPVLELGNLGPKPAILYAGMAICAFTFEKLTAPVRMSYEGSRSDRYSGSRDAIASRIENNNKVSKKK